MSERRKSPLPLLLVVLGVLVLPIILFGGECAQGYRTGWNASQGVPPGRGP